jgi:enoyl-CoA hydratase/carnithine racemase
VSELVDVEVRGRVAVVSMRREAKRNAVDRRLADALDVALNRLDDDPELWEGTRRCRGQASLAAMNGRAAAGRPGAWLFARVLHRIGRVVSRLSPQRRAGGRTIGVFLLRRDPTP